MNPYLELLRPGELAFDVGANVGEEARLMLKAGARVVAVEPQQACCADLTLVGCTAVVRAAVTDRNGLATLWTCGHSQLACLHLLDTRRPLIDPDLQWSGADVFARTLDGLISDYGAPSLVKLDVEGSELRALQGLSHPVPIVMFEAWSFAPERAEACKARLRELGDYRFEPPDDQSMILARLQ